MIDISSDGDNIVQTSAVCSGIKFTVHDNFGKEMGRAFLYVMRNDLHNQPFGLMEDVYITEKMRGQGLGKSLVKQVIEKARAIGCYKLIATSRYSRDRIHKLYLELRFKDYGKEFRINF